jgi:hypothetical protein
MDGKMGLAGWSVPEAWGPWLQGVTEGLSSTILIWGALTAGLLLLISLIAIRVVRRRVFWCAQAQRDVEVNIEERGLPGFRRRAAVVSCSAFESPTEVQCRRSCLDQSIRVKLPMTPPFRLKEP